MKKRGIGKKEEDAIDEVEQLLKLTQDDLLLKLTVNTHQKSNTISKFQPSSSSSSSTLNSDLDRRFQALCSKSKPSQKEESEDVDTLFARFAALKGGGEKSASNNVVIEDKEIHGNDVFEDGDEEDEVAKIISWAVDAARLDPSPSSDVDDQDDEDSDDEDSDDEDSDSDDRVKRKVIGKKVLKK